jgi:hypothetical protein
MKIYVEQTATAPFAIDITTTQTGFTYMLRDVWVTEELHRIWGEVAAGNLTIGDNASIPKPTDAVHSVRGIYTVYDNPVFQPQTLNFADFTTLNDFSDHAFYMIYNPMSPNFTGFEYSSAYPNSKAENVRFEKFTNIYTKTAAGKVHPYAHTNPTNARMIGIGIPFKDSNYSDWHIIVSTLDACLVNVISNDEVTLDVDSVGKFLSTTFGKVVFENETATVAPDGKVTLPFYLTNPDGTPTTTNNATVYFKTTGGMLNKQQVATENGVGTVAFIASHLDAGDSVKVSVGFKYFSGTSDCIITVG